MARPVNPVRHGRRPLATAAALAAAAALCGAAAAGPDADPAACRTLTTDEAWAVTGGLDVPIDADPPEQFEITCCQIFDGCVPQDCGTAVAGCAQRTKKLRVRDNQKRCADTYMDFQPVEPDVCIQQPDKVCVAIYKCKLNETGDFCMTGAFVGNESNPEQCGDEGGCDE